MKKIKEKLILTKSVCKSQLQCLRYKWLSALHELQQPTAEAKEEGMEKPWVQRQEKLSTLFHGHLQYSLSLNFNITLFLLENQFISFLSTGRSTFFLS